LNKKIILIIIVILVGVGLGIYQGFVKREKPNFALEKVVRGEIFQEIAETGTVKAAKEIDLGFENPGKIEEIYLKVGERVNVNQPLIKLETSELEIQLAEVQANLEMVQAQLDKLLAGASLEEIKIAETEVKNAEINLTLAKENLNQAYEDALNILADSYLKFYNAFSSVDSIQRLYFTTSEQESLKVKENKEKIENKMFQAKSLLDIAKENRESKNIEIALSEMEKGLEITFEALTIIREICESPLYQNKISLVEKNSLDNQRNNINIALTNLINTKQNISSRKLNLNLAEGQLQKAKDQLALVKAEPKKEDITLYQAQIKQVQAKIDLLKEKIEKSTLKSPIEGVVSQINKKIGEIVQMGESVISLFSSNEFQIEVNIYEEDIPKIKIGAPVNITLVAFPDKIFKGRVISIKPAEKLIEKVVIMKL
jgi:multidrug efflux pump subunit AcrA (membrane-fusion protein)